MPKLTKKAIDEAKPGATRLFLWDSELRGFGLVVQPSGTRSFCIQYRNAAGRERRMMLGRYGVLTVDEARRMAKAALADVASGADPMGDKRAYREAPTLNDLFDRYLEEHVGPHNAPSTAKDVEAMLKFTCGPASAASRSTTSSSPTPQSSTMR